MSQPVNIGVIGAGYWGPNLIRNFNSLPGFQVKYVCDTDRQRLDHMKNLFPGVQTVNDAAVLMNDSELDAVAVATSVSQHYPLAKMSLEAGKHTFIEKPMASSVTECRDLIGLAEKKQLTLMVGHTFIYTSAVRKIKEIVEDRENFGELYYISSRRLNLGLFQKDINVAWDLAPHDISIILYIMGQAPDSVNCQGEAHITPAIEDVTNMSLSFPGGGFATIHSSWLDPNKIRMMTIVGSKKMIVYDDNETLEKIKIYDKRVEVPPHYDTFAEFQYSYHYGDMNSPYLKQNEPLKVECQHFLDSISNGRPPDSSGKDGLQVIQILEASSKSLKEGGARIEIEK
jgi:predicted dehydrogenase